MKDKIEIKIAEAQEVLRSLGMQEQQQNKLCGLTLLALANLKPEQSWNEATTKGMTLSKDIMEFVNENYKADYKANTRESFRKIALKPFIDHNIAVLNPDEPGLSQSSSRTHYALSSLVLDTLKKFNTADWQEAVENFKLNQFPTNIPSTITLRKIVIKNFKSIVDEEINLGRINVFVGANGSGKSNVLEAIAAVGAAKAKDLSLEGLYSRGVRIARPDLMISSFWSVPQKANMEFELEFEEGNKKEVLKSSLYPDDPNDIYTSWSDEVSRLATTDLVELRALIREAINKLSATIGHIPTEGDVTKAIGKQVGLTEISDNPLYIELLAEYAIFDLNTKSLRGITPSDSRKTPLGINGEGLDLLIATFNTYEKEFLEKTSKELFEWIEKIQSQRDEKVKAEGLKAGRSSSTLYFSDKFMLTKNNVLSAENSNEGILHVLFYLALFISSKTPSLFAIDNIETALNPKLCRTLMTQLAQLAKERGKQVLITTHNPAILDGLNLYDEEQRLFEVRRDSEGRTRIRRIKFKADLADKKFKLSEMWLKGLIGAIPQNF